MTGKSLFIKDKNSNFNYINDLTPHIDGQVKMISCGLDKHYENAEKINNRLHPNNILQFKKLFKCVIEEGIIFDKTINDNITFEEIRRIDVDKKKF